MHRRTTGKFRSLAALVGLLFAIFGAGVAHADHLVVARDVTVRAEPTRRSEVVTFPEIGAALTLLDDGRQVDGYYHVRLPDGREGWIYRNFVRRVSGDIPAVALTSAAGDRIVVHYINVDQGGSALLEFPCGAVLIDAGGRGTAAGDHLLEYLEAFFDRRWDLHRRLDAIFITHPHLDHNAYLKRIVGEPGAATFQIGAFIHNGRLNGRISNWMKIRLTAAPAIREQIVTDADIEEAGTAGVGGELIDPLSCDRVDPQIRVLSGAHPRMPGWSARENTNENNHSLVIRIDYGDSSFLFTGDLEDRAIERLVEHYRGTLMLDIDVYEPGHHGSNNGTTDDLLTAMTPELAVISVGERTSRSSRTAWSYGHPGLGAVTMLERVITRARAPIDGFVGDGAEVLVDHPVTKAIYATGWDGDITVTGDASGNLEVQLGE